MGLLREKVQVKGYLNGSDGAGFWIDESPTEFAERWSEALSMQELMPVRVLDAGGKVSHTVHMNPAAVIAVKAA